MLRVCPEFLLEGDLDVEHPLCSDFQRKQLHPPEAAMTFPGRSPFKIMREGIIEP